LIYDLLNFEIKREIVGGYNTPDTVGEKV